MDITIELEGLSSFLSALDPLSSVVTAGVASQGDPSNYALIWEFGRLLMGETDHAFAALGGQPGPRTVYGVNGLGEAAIMSSQAPTGYIRVNQDRYADFVREAVAGVDWGDLTNLRGNIEDAVNKAAGECRDLIAQTAPVDTGALSFSFEVVESGDQLLNTQDAAVLG